MKTLPIILATMLAVHFLTAQVTPTYSQNPPQISLSGLFGVKFQQDSVPSSEGNTPGGAFATIMPIIDRPDAVPFLFSRTATPQWNGTRSPNEVVMWGHNLAGGGSAFYPGMPGIGYSLESNYLPDPQTRFVESHEFYITPQNQQVRLKSYTINTANNHVDFYHSVDNLSVRKPFTNMDYFYIGSDGNSVYNSWATPRARISWQLSGDNTFIMRNEMGNGSLIMRDFTGVFLPGVILTGGYNRLTNTTFPENDNQFELGKTGNRWANVSSFKFSGDRMMLRTGMGSYDQLNPTATLDLQGDGASQLRLRNTFTPGSAGDRGDAGNMGWDDNFLYLKTSRGWKKVPLQTL